MVVADFETMNALRELDQRTPEYFRWEAWAHGDTRTVCAALGILQSGLDPAERTGYTLRSLLRLIPEEAEEEGKNAG